MPRDIRPKKLGRVSLVARIDPELRDAVREEAARLGEPFSAVVSRLLLIALLELRGWRSEGKRPRKGVGRGR